MIYLVMEPLQCLFGKIIAGCCGVFEAHQKYSEDFEVHSFQVSSYRKFAVPVTEVQLDSPFMF